MSDEIITARDTYRIRMDAMTAIDALESLVQAPALSAEYIAEKSRVAQNCLDFIKTFSKQ